MHKETSEKKQQLCLSCMECCKTLAFSILKKFLDKNTKDFYKARGARFKKDGKSVWVVIPSICPNLTTFGCKIYDRRPVVCRTFDGRNFPFMWDKCKWNEEKERKEEIISV